MLPPALVPPGYANTLASIRNAIENRITNTTFRLSSNPSFHRGTPDSGAVESEALSVWLDWTGIDVDEDEPFGAAMLQSNWLISIVTHDEGNDAFGSESPMAERIWGDIMTTFTETSVDIGLDDTCDFVMTPTTRKTIGALSSGRRIVMLEVEAIVRHSAEIVRCPPNP